MDLSHMQAAIEAAESAPVVLQVKCGTCGEQLRGPDAIPKRRFSGIVNYDATLCRECQSGWAGYSRIVCVKCHRLVAFMKPRREPCGFTYKQEFSYHVRHCPTCHPTTADGRPSPGASVMEYEMYCRDQKLAIKPNEDLIQEIEQKSLQAEAEATKMLANLAQSSVFSKL